MGHGIAGRVKEYVVGCELDDPLVASGAMSLRRAPPDFGPESFGDGDWSKTVRLVEGKYLMTGSRSVSVVGNRAGKAKSIALLNTMPETRRRLWGVFPPVARMFHTLLHSLHADC